MCLPEMGWGGGGVKLLGTLTYILYFAFSFTELFLDPSVSLTVACSIPQTVGSFVFFSHYSQNKHTITVSGILIK